MGPRPEPAERVTRARRGAARSGDSKTQGRAQHAPPPTAGAAEGGATGEGSTLSNNVTDAGSTTATRSKPDKRQNAGDSRDTPQQHSMTLGTSCGIFDRLGYSKEGDVNDNIPFGTQDSRHDGEGAEDQDNGDPDAGTKYDRRDEGPQDLPPRAQDATMDRTADAGTTTNNWEFDTRPAKHTSTTFDKRQSNGDSQNMAQRPRMTPDTAWDILER